MVSAGSHTRYASIIIDGLFMNYEVINNERIVIHELFTLKGYFCV